MPDQRQGGRRLARIVKRYRLGWALVTLLLYVVALPVTVVVFPANNLWLALIVLFSGFTASLTTLADLLISAETSDAAHDPTPSVPDDWHSS